MNAKNFELAKGLVRPAYVDQGAQSVAARQKLLTSLLSERRLPPRGWDEASIELLVREAAAMDSNNFLANVGVGEREARVACPLVARRHYGFAHGIGRSGDISAEQPKAAGSTLLARLCNLLAVDSLKKAGLLEVGDVTVLPVATGMALTLTLLALAKRRPGARYVVWPRCDQKTCVKAVQAAGLELLVVANVLEGDQLRTDVQAVRVAVESVGAAAVVCVLSTSSCFAPRAADRLVELAQLCASLDVGHVVNNAYGVQSAALCALLTSACRRGRVDAIVQSTDKNFMVPVGGALVAAPRREGPSLVEAVNRAYPGRACMAPLLDLLMTLLHLGSEGWLAALRAREAGYSYLRQRLAEVAAEHGERLLETPRNPISLGMTLSTLAAPGEANDAERVTFFGSMLFSRCVSGTRTVPLGKSLEVGGITFQGYGAHHDCYPVPYLTAAASLGMTHQDVDDFCVRLRKCFADAGRH